MAKDRLQANSSTAKCFKWVSTANHIETLFIEWSLHSISSISTMAGVAQLVESRIVIPVVAGSNPVARPIFFSSIFAYVLSLYQYIIPHFL